MAGQNLQKASVILEKSKETWKSSYENFAEHIWEIHIQIPLTGYCKVNITTYSGYCKLE